MIHVHLENRCFITLQLFSSGHEGLNYGLVNSRPVLEVEFLLADGVTPSGCSIASF